MIRIKTLILILAFFCLATGFAFADRQLSEEEITEIFQSLTSQPRSTWLTRGTIEADHLSFRASTGYTIESTEIAKFNNGSFRWEIDILSHSRDKRRQNKTEDIDIRWNVSRVFTWDGQQYVMYFKSGKQAIISESSNDLPVKLPAPMTAGRVPWGLGMYAVENLISADSSGSVENIKDGTRVHLTITFDDKPAMNFILDPEKDYAVLSTSWENSDSSVERTYGSYVYVSGEWIPRTIVIQQYDKSTNPPRLRSQDLWNFTSVNSDVHGAETFQLIYEKDSIVEFHSPLIAKPLSYRSSGDPDTEILLQERIVAALSDDEVSSNCGTLAIRHVLNKLQREVDDSSLTPLIDGDTNTTNLYGLREFALGHGLNCLAIKANTKILASLDDCQAILYLPKEKHFVVMDYYDDEYIWIIDLGAERFYDKIKIKNFENDWVGGITLLISDKTIQIEGNLNYLTDDELKTIAGSIPGGIPDYSCDDMIQDYNVRLCSEMMLGMCPGVYQVWYPRYACGVDAEGGNCTGDGLVGSVYSYCWEDLDYPGECDTDGDYYMRYIHACR